MRIHLWLIPSSFLSLLALAACSSSSAPPEQHVTYGQAAAVMNPAFCKRFQECDPSSFSGTFADGGVDQCIAFANGIAFVPETDATKCTQAQLDQCVADIEKLGCDALLESDGGSDVPASCHGC